MKVLKFEKCKANGKDFLTTRNNLLRERTINFMKS